MGASNYSNSQHALADINITPLCDVLLVLLIIFMVTAPLLTQGIDVNLPQTKAPKVERQQDDVIVTIKPAGKQMAIFLGDAKTAVQRSELEQQLRTVFAERERKDLFLKADSTVPYGEVAQVMAIAKLAGIERIGMMTQPEGR